MHKMSFLAALEWHKLDQEPGIPIITFQKKKRKRKFENSPHNAKIPSLSFNVWFAASHVLYDKACKVHHIYDIMSLSSGNEL